nr:MAG TPA: hypothetical protein [Caudoviricetes sp.]
MGAPADRAGAPVVRVDRSGLRPGGGVVRSPAVAVPVWVRVPP